MNDEFTNRQAMFRTLLDVADRPEHRAAWEGQPPAAFAKRLEEFRTLVGELEGLLREQSARITGAAERKRREEEELEVVAHEVGQLLGAYCQDVGDEQTAAEVAFSASVWQRFRQEELLPQARLVEERLRARLATAAAELADYGLDDAVASRLHQEIEDFAQVIATPSSAIAGRKALTAALRPRFRAGSDLLAQLDRLIVGFRRTAPGRAFAEAWEAARVVRDLGAAPSRDGVSSEPPAA